MRTCDGDVAPIFLLKSYHIYIIILRGECQVKNLLVFVRQNVTQIKSPWTCFSTVGKHYKYLGVSENRGTPKWMVYNAKPNLNGWFGGTTILGNPQLVNTTNYLKNTTGRDHSSSDAWPNFLGFFHPAGLSTGGSANHPKRAKMSHFHWFFNHTRVTN